MDEPRDDVAPALERAAEARREGRLEVAEELCRQLVAMGLDDARIHLELGRVLEAHGRLAAAVESYAQSVSEAPDEAATHVALAMALHDLGRLQEAISSYEAALAIEPNDPRVLHSYGYALTQSRQPEAAVETYRAALRLAPDQPGLGRDLAATLEALGRIGEAVQVFEAALARDPDDLRAHRLLTRLCLRAVPRWHFPMLNDAGRNEAYDRAIRAVVRPGDLVLDIGTGSGLLAMMAARAGAELVVSCEMVGPLVEVARGIISDNGLSDAIRVVHKPSTALRVGADLPRRADVLISEIVDAGLLGENLLPIVRHAREHLVAPEGRVVPEAAEVRAMLIESEALVATERVEMAAGFDVRRFNRFAVPGYLPRRLKGHAHRALSLPMPVFDFDLRSPPTRTEQGEVGELTVVPTATGTAHGVAFWFRLRLAEEVVLDSGPDGDQGHWVQAVQLIEPRLVRAGVPVGVVGVHDGLHIAFRWAGPAAAEA